MSSDYLSALTNKKQRKAGERYGINHSDYGFNRPGGGGIQKKNPQNYGADVAKAAMNDYDTRRSIEAAAMSGKKKAEKYAKDGFSNLEDVTKANNMFRKMHERHGNGGDFSSASDYAGLTYDLVQRDRRKFTEGLEAKSADEQQAEVKDEPKEMKDIVLSDHMQKAKERVDNWENGSTNTNIYNPASALQSQATGEPEAKEDKFGLNKAINVATAGGQTPISADDHLSIYKKDVAAGLSPMF